MISSSMIMRVVILVSIFHAVAMFVYSYPSRMARTDTERDLVAYYLLVERMNSGHDIYAGVYERGPHSAKYAVYQYPPVLSSVLHLLPEMSFETFARLWTTMLYLCFWIYAACLAKITFRHFTFVGLMIVGLFLTLFPGTHMALSLGQIDPLLWALMGISLISTSARSGVLVLISLIKPWALFPLLFVLHEERRSFVTASMVAGFFLLLGVFTRGLNVYFNEWSFWFAYILPSLGQGSWSADNWSVSFVLLRILDLFSFFGDRDGVLPLWARIWLLFCGVAVPLIVGFYMLKKNIMLKIAVVGSCAVVLSPLCWITYLPAILTVMALFARDYFLKLRVDCNLYRI